MRCFRNLILGILAFGLLYFFYTHSHIINTREHANYIRLLRTHQYLDTVFNENILKSRHGYLNNYDFVVDNLRKLKSTGQELRLLPQFIDPGVKEELNALLDRYNDLLGQKETLSERFKSENSILYNSLSFFPVAASELADTSDATNKETAFLVRMLLKSILTHSLYPYEESLQKIKIQIRELYKREGELSAETDPVQFRRVIRHAETILKYRQQLDKVTFELINIPTRNFIQSVYKVYHDHYIEKQNTANGYRLALYLTAIGMMVIIAYSFISLTNTKKALDHANEGLEQKVQDRTRDLNRANIHLEEKQEQLVEYLGKLKQTHEELKRVAMTDALTGIYTRRFLFEWMEKQVTFITRNSGRFGCMLLDIDFFKSINDTFGHGQGDTVLKKVAQVIKQAVRKGDIVGRYGGEEFLVLLPNANLSQAGLVAEKIRVDIERNITVPKQITLSIGVGSCTCIEPVTVDVDVSNIVQSLLDVTDKALYKAKENGRNQVKKSDQEILIF